jgi:membrane associated rhomboid family serine protease
MPPRPGIGYSFGPGPMTPAVRAIIYTNVAVFVVTLVLPGVVISTFGLSPALVIEKVRVWQLMTYLFVHSPSQFSHILFNMLSVWMFGVDLERRWGTREFVKYYFITGIGAGVSMILVSLLPFASTSETYGAVTIGASGAVYGLLMAWGLLFPHRQILFMLIFPLSARVFVLIMGAIAFVSAVGASGGPVANVAHLGGLLMGFLYLKGPTNLQMELRYRMTKWRMERMRRRFNLHKGGRDNWGNRIH